MGIKDINDNSQMTKKWIDNEKAAKEQYYKQNPDSLIFCFEDELKKLGFDFTIGSQAIRFVPKHKETVLPIAGKYYLLAKEQRRFNEQNYFINFLGFKGFDEIVPQLLIDFYSQETPNLTRWFISDCLYRIQSKQFIAEYLRIVSNAVFGQNRQMIVLLLGKIKEESAIPTLIDLLEDEEVRLQAICALGEFKREEFRCYFEQFQDSTHSGYRKYARAALKKLDCQKK